MDDKLRLPTRTTVDVTLDVAGAVAMGVVASVPFIGPVIQGVVGAAWTEVRSDRLERFATELRADVDELGDRVDADFVTKAEFAAMTEDVIERILRRRNETKIEAYAAALARSSTFDRPSERDRARLLDDLDALQPIQLEILARLAAGGPEWVRPGDVLTVGQVVNSKLGQALAGLDVDPSDFAELERRGFMRPLDDTGALLAAADDIKVLIAPRGREFLGFVTNDWTGAAVAQSVDMEGDTSFVPPEVFDRTPERQDELERERIRNEIGKDQARRGRNAAYGPDRSG